MRTTSQLGWSIRIALLSSGERLPLLIREPFGLPDQKVTEFVLTQLRPKGRAANTISAYLRAIAAALGHFEKAGISLEERLVKRLYFTTSELTCFSSTCKRGGRQLRINSDEARRRYDRFLEYVRWLAAPIISRASSDVSLDRAQKALKRFDLRAAAVAPAKDESLPSPDARGGLTASQRDLLLSVIRPDDERNPWQHRGARYRNFVMLSLAQELGPRAGDVLSLKIRDLDLSHRPATVAFHRRHDDPEDPRKHQPVLKTKPRILVISDSLALSLEYWIDKVRFDRKMFPNARKHPFVFISSRGDPLSQRGYQYIYERLRDKFPEIAQMVSHVFRFDWNERWTEVSSAEGANPSSAVREQCYAMGWSDRSAMPERYSRRAISESANGRIGRMHAAAEERGKRYRQGKSDEQ